MTPEAHDHKAFHSGSGLGVCLSLKNSIFGCHVARAFPARTASILFVSIFGHKIGVLKSPALFQGK